MGNEIKEKEALEYKIQELKYHLKIAEHTVLEQKIQIEKAKKLRKIIFWMDISILIIVTMTFLLNLL